MRGLLLLLAVAAGPLSAEPKLALRGFDPVDLVAGRETAGQSAVSLDRGDYRYQFSSAANRAAFEAAPERYEVQFGGACMKMGPVSGAGSPDRWEVFGGRIYLFASDFCRDAFRQSPVDFIDTADPLPSGTAPQTAAAQALLDRAVRALGGAGRLRAVQTWELETAFAMDRGKGGLEFRHLASYRAPDRYVLQDTWPEYQGAHGVGPGGGRMSGQAGTTPASVAAFIQRELYRHPLPLLQAWLRGEATAVAVGAQRVRISVAGATSLLELHPFSGQIVSLTWRGRGALGLTTLRRSYSDFRPTGGLVLPWCAELRAGGQPVTNPVRRIAAQRVNQAPQVVQLRELLSD
ncbi:MAG: hypothetical protein IT204_10475 [Fimbriimonadaceae bacterium]|nr:hypothetical protein [Fimbriimonadaceae bacterium]